MPLKVSLSTNIYNYTHSGDAIDPQTGVWFIYRTQAVFSQCTRLRNIGYWLKSLVFLPLKREWDTQSPNPACFPYNILYNILQRLALLLIFQHDLLTNSSVFHNNDFAILLRSTECSSQQRCPMPQR